MTSPTNPIRFRSSWQHALKVAKPATVFCLMLCLCWLNVGCATSEGIKDVRNETEFSFWPLYPDEPRVQFLTSLSRLDDVNRQSRNAIEKILYGQDDNSNPSLIEKPYGVSVANGRIYVCDIKGQIAVMDLLKHQTRIMGTKGSNPVQRPVDLAIADDGLIYVADAGRSLILVFDQDERSTAVFAVPGMNPIGVTTFEDELFVVDKAGASIRVLDRFSGEQKRVFGNSGSPDEKLGSPLGITSDQTGNIYVTDVIQCRIRKYTNEGEFVGIFGQIGDQLGSFVRPKHVQVDSDGNIYIVDSGFANVQIFNKDFELLMFFGAGGEHPGAMFLPVGISVFEGDLDFVKDYVHEAFEPKRLIVVTNQMGPDKTSLYALGELRPGYTAQDLVSTSVAITGTLEEGGNQIGQIGDTTELDAPSDDVEGASDGEEGAEEKSDGGG